MKNMKQLTFITLIGICFGSNTSAVIQNVDISGQWFLAFNNASEINQFVLKRGYFTIKTKMNDVYSLRYTQDITLDREGNDAGNVEIRLKYLYLKIKLDQIDFLKNSNLEVGLVHRPWLDFEQNVNKYRILGKMFLERYGIINSADFGIFYTRLIGGNICDEYQSTVTNKNPGKYGSFAIGLYNGGGYHAIEQNNNKTLEGRFSIRPFHEMYPGLQLTYAFTYGKANTESNLSDFNMNLLYLSSESRLGAFTGTYFTGNGDYSGKYVDEQNNSITHTGYSLFGELKIPKTKFSIFGRLDEFQLEKEAIEKRNTYIGGLSYNFLKSKVLFNVDYQKNPDESIKIYEIALEIGF